MAIPPASTPLDCLCFFAGYVLRPSQTVAQFTRFYFQLWEECRVICAHSDKWDSIDISVIIERKHLSASVTTEAEETRSVFGNLAISIEVSSSDSRQYQR